jgi:hypothetical protein
MFTVIAVTGYNQQVALFKVLIAGCGGVAKASGTCGGLQWFGVICSGFDGTRANSAECDSFKIQWLTSPANPRKVAALVS